MTNFLGTAGDDNLTGTYGGDYFNLAQGGDDHARGGAGVDTFSMEASMTSADRLEGGLGSDTVYIDGDYSAGLTILAATLSDIETLYLFPGFDYDITIADGANQAASGMSVNAGALGAGDSLRFNGSKETASPWYLFGGAGDDQLIGGGGADSFALYAGGDDFVVGGAGPDQLSIGDGLDRGDRLNGGDGRDSLYLYGADYSLTFRANTVRFVENFQLSDGFDYRLRLHDNTIAAGEMLTVSAYQLTGSHKAVIDASRETDGDLQVVGGAGRDVLTGGGGDAVLSGGAGGDNRTGGDGDDQLWGQGGHDVLSGGAGQDIFLFREGETSSGNPDLITDLGAADVIDISGIDANTSLEFDQAFTVVSHFTHAAGQLDLVYDPGDGVTHMLMDTDGDAVADLAIDATGNRASFTQFIL
jgi:Ca2+-binding RTX toxin-like protein